MRAEGEAEEAKTVAEVTTDGVAATRGTTAKRAAEVARDIEAEIIRRGWPIGEVLGSEAELRERFGVSRAVLREALLLVEHHRVGKMRRGRQGGLVVTAPDSLPAIRALVIYLEYLALSAENLVYARLLLEPLAARLACGRINDEGRERLRQTLALEELRRKDAGIFAQEPLHVLLGALSGNPALHLFIDVLSRLTTRYAHTARSITSARVRTGKAESRHAHAVIAEAVAEANAARAESAMMRHLEGVGNWLATEGKRKSSRRPNTVSHLADGPDPKVADVVAAQIHDEIARRNWPVGLVLGSEADLIARYGVGREAIREAVALLEFHSVARMRKGPGGGLIVAQPDPTASIESVALVLDHHTVTPADLREVRDAIELGALEQVIRLTTAGEIESRLNTALQEARSSSAPLQVRGDSFHVALAELSHNPVLTLFLRILSELWSRHAVVPDMPELGPEAEAEVERAHQLILDALAAGDFEKARSRLRRHLTTLTRWYH